MKIFIKLLLASCVLSLAACSPFSVTKVEPGEKMVGERLSLKLDQAWNHVKAPGINGPNSESWSLEGLPIDELTIFTGLKNDEPIHPPSYGDKKKIGEFKFRSDMQTEQIVALFEGMLGRDGSTFKLDKLSPMPFAGGKGFRFEYSLIRKRDNVELSGIASGIVDKGQLYAVVYQAPRLVFFPRHQQRVLQLMNSARLKG